MAKRDTEFLNKRHDIDYLLRNPNTSGPVLLHILLVLERIEKTLVAAFGPIEEDGE